MALTYGYFDHKDHDIAYNANDINQYFNGILGDGVYRIGYIYGEKSVWYPKVWNGDLPYGMAGSGYIWTDGDNIYYTYYSTDKVLDKSTDTWTEKIWNGARPSFGPPATRNVWIDGNNAYYSYRSNQYVLDKSTDTWNPKTWNGLTSFNGRNVWTDGNNIYYSNGSAQYVLDKSTDTWNPKIWNGLTSFDGYAIWADGDTIYYSDGGSQQYVLDKSTNTWIQKTWNENGFTNIFADYIWSDGNGVYYSNQSEQYILDRQTSTWESIVWEGIDTSYFNGSLVWTDGENTYFSYEDNQLVLNKKERSGTDRFSIGFNSDTPSIIVGNGKALFNNIWVVNDLNAVVINLDYDVYYCIYLEINKSISERKCKIDAFEFEKTGDHPLDMLQKGPEIFQYALGYVKLMDDNTHEYVNYVGTDATPYMTSILEYPGINVRNSHEITEPGYVLDARQGTLINDELVDKLPFKFAIVSGAYGYYKNGAFVPF